MSASRSLPDFSSHPKIITEFAGMEFHYRRPAVRP